MTLTCNDQAGRTASCTGTVTVEDKVAPTLALNSPGTTTLECARDIYSELGATANDACPQANLTSSIVITNPLGTTSPAKPAGTYNVTYNVKDAANNNATPVQRPVVVVDTLKPTIALNGAVNQAVECSATATYAEPGATATDLCATIAPGSIVRNSNVNIKVPGAYSTTYDVRDPSNNAADQVTRLVTVRDTTVPTLTVAPNTTVNVECGGPVNHPPVTVSDTCFTAGPFTAPVPSRAVNNKLLGGQSITYSATDPAGNTGISGPRTFQVADTLPPTFAGLPTAPMNLECGDPFTAPTVTANDQCAGDLTASIQRTGSVNNKVLGPQTLGYSVTDNRTAPISASVTVNVNDTLAPVVSLTGAATASVECGSGYSDQGATANDKCAGVLTPARTGQVQTGTPGTYPITYTATDGAGLTGSATRTVTVSDTLAPVLNLNGPANPDLECGTAFVDPITANDACAGDLTAQIQKNGTVNHQQPNTYPLSYSVTDPSGKSATANRTVRVRDTLAPTVSMTGATSAELECGTGPFQDPGGSASDACFKGALTVVPTVVVNQQNPGTYTIQYQATDPSGNTGTAAGSRTVTVRDTQEPVLTLNGAANMGLECGAVYNEEGATANDVCRGTLPVTITGGVPQKQVGTFKVGYRATDGVFNKTAERTVNVTDTVAPNLAINGDPNTSYECGSTYTDQGATASDACADASALVVTTQVVGNPGSPGSFTVNYTATDPSGNQRVLTGARTVTVNDNMPPVLVRNGVATVGVECGDAYNDEGARATDACDGDVTNRIQTVNPVATGTVGSYTVRYNVRDQSGQAAPEVTRSVVVSDTRPPNLTVNGPLSQTLECGNGTYQDPGATGSDSCSTVVTVTPSTVVDQNAPNTYTISYTARDASGNTRVSDVSRTVVVQDTLPPQLTLTGPATAGVECGTPYNDQGATASDLCVGTLPVTRTGNVDHMNPNTYTLTFTATDGTRTATATRTVGVTDTLAPNITVLGPPNDTFECGSTYVDPGATANDVCAGNLTAQIEAIANGDPTQPGVVRYDYRVTDPSGNVRTVTNARTVTVNDNEAPVLALNGAAAMTLECEVDEYNELRATANDACFGDVSNRIRIGGDTVINDAPATFRVTYDVTDPAGKSAPQQVRVVTVRDTQAPTINVLPPFAQKFECGTGPYTDPGATAFDTCAKDLTAAIQKTGTVLPGAAGQYTLSYSVTDPSGNQTAAAQSRTVTVEDTLPPSIALTGAATVGVECGTAYNEQGATANDACAGNLAVNISGTVNTGTVGANTITYTAQDPSGLSATTTRAVNVSDTLPPTLTLEGPATQLVECRGQYADPGAKATDLCAGDLTANIVVGGAVDPAVLGPYTVTYNVSDPSGRAAPQVTRNVTVQDTLAPAITVTGPLSQQHECGSSYIDPGATANDQCVGDVTSRIVATRTGNPNAPGSFDITYSVTDLAGNSATSPVRRTVTVNDTSAPTLALVGPAVVNVECAAAYADQGAVANDACFGDLTDDIVDNRTVVNTAVPNQYTIIYNVADPAGQVAPPVSRTVNVRDTQAPSLNVVGPLDTTFQCGTTYQDPGATANDACAGNLTNQVVATSTPVAGQPGVTSISYSVTDPAGNTTTSAVSRTVRMIDEEAPVVTLVGAATERKECGTPYLDPGATANDACVGPLTVTVSGTVDHTTAGNYTLTYTAMDVVGNIDTETRVVTVIDTVGPSIVLNGANPMYLECKVDSWVDPKAVSNDLCSGSQEITGTGAVNTAVPNGYTVRYEDADNSGNLGVPAIRNVIVRDTLAPVMTLNGPNPMILECALGNLNNDPLAKVEDACYGNTSHTVFREFTDLNINQPGNYIARYQGDDTVGHVVQITRDLQVVDTTAPVLQVQSQGETVECGTQPSLGVTATDACYGPVPVIASPASLPSTPGTYTVTYSAVDPAGNVADGSGAVTRTIEVVDSVDPVLSIADQDVYYECTGYAIGNVWNAPEATATDTCEGSIPVHQYNTGDDDEDGVPGSIDPDDFGPGPTTEVEGLYYVQYLAWDETYNIQGAILSVYVRDTLKPVLWLNDDNDGGDPAYEQVECFLPRTGGQQDPNPYVNPGASAEDQCYGDLNQEVVSFGEVNKQVPGLYTLTYRVRDGAYNWADDVQRSVEVIDSLQPTVTDRNTHIGSPDGNMRTVELSQCAIADDRCEGVLAINTYGGVDAITVNEPGDHSNDIEYIPGTSSFKLRAKLNADGSSRVYTVNFTVSDSSGNQTASQCLIRVPLPPRVVSPANNGVSNTSTPTYTGTATPNSTVRVFVDGSTNPVGTVTADANGAWSFTQPTALANGLHTVYVREVDANGLEGQSAVNTFRVQTTLAGR
ncbi:MAG TPA: immunoglobulin-like domain-containing protein [Myxococcaceae bacterium]